MLAQSSAVQCQWEASAATAKWSFLPGNWSTHGVAFWRATQNHPVSRGEWKEPEDCAMTGTMPRFWWTYELEKHISPHISWFLSLVPWHLIPTPAQQWHCQAYPLHAHLPFQGHIEAAGSWGSLLKSGMRTCQQLQPASLSLDLEKALSNQSKNDATFS